MFSAGLLLISGPIIAVFPIVSGVRGGFTRTDTIIENGALIVLYHSDLKSVKNKILRSGGIITKIFFLFRADKDFILKIRMETNLLFGLINKGQNNLIIEIC